MKLTKVAHYNSPNGNSFKSFIIDDKYFISTFNNKITVIRKSGYFGIECNLPYSEMIFFNKHHKSRFKTIIQ